MTELTNVENLRQQIQASCDALINHLGPIHIGNPEQFPFGWRDAAKGRTVWRIVEEAVTQNMERHFQELNMTGFHLPDSEVAVYDMACSYGAEYAYINIKTATENGRNQKDDISKADGLRNFYEEDLNRHIFIVTFFIRFNDDMSIELTRATVFPLSWIPDIYVNPSNNGNLQSSHYKDIHDATPRTNTVFYNELVAAIQVANEKKARKSNTQQA